MFLLQIVLNEFDSVRNAGMFNGIAPYYKSLSSEGYLLALTGLLLNIFIIVLSCMFCNTKKADKGIAITLSVTILLSLVVVSAFAGEYDDYRASAAGLSLVYILLMAGVLILTAVYLAMLVSNKIQFENTTVAKPAQATAGIACAVDARIAMLKRLKDEGTLTDAEYKKRVLEIIDSKQFEQITQIPQASPPQHQIQVKQVEIAKDYNESTGGPMYKCIKPSMHNGYKPVEKRFLIGVGVTLIFATAILLSAVLHLIKVDKAIVLSIAIVSMIFLIPSLFLTARFAIQMMQLIMLTTLIKEIQAKESHNLEDLSLAKKECTYYWAISKDSLIRIINRLIETDNLEGYEVDIENNRVAKKGIKPETVEIEKPKRTRKVTK